MNRLLFLFIFAICGNICVAQRFCGLPRVFSAIPTATYTITPIRTPVKVPQPMIENIEMIQMVKTLKQLQNNPVEDYDCGCFSSEIISKLIDALVVSTSQRNCERYDRSGNLLNIGLGDTDLLGISV